MFVDVEFLIELPEAVTVPVDAIVDSSLRKTVFVARATGLFEPRSVETGGTSAIVSRSSKDSSRAISGRCRTLPSRLGEPDESHGREE